MARSTGKILVSILLVLICLSCIHIPKGPYQDVVYSSVFEGRDSTTILGEIKLEKGEKYYYRVTDIPEGDFDVGIYFKAKHGPPWFPDKEFPTDAIVKISVYEEKKRICALKSPLSRWSQSPWGPELLNRCLSSPLDDAEFYEIERDQVICESRTNKLMTYDIYRDTDLAWRPNKNLQAGWAVLSKKSGTYYIVYEIVKGDLRAEKLTAFAGITCFERKLK